MKKEPLREKPITIDDTDEDIRKVSGDNIRRETSQNRELKIEIETLTLRPAQHIEHTKQHTARPGKKIIPGQSGRAIEF